MAHTDISTHHTPTEPQAQHLPQVQTIDIEAPWRWLSKGWHDYKKAPILSILYGAVFALGGYLLLYGLRATEQTFMILPLASGFLLLAPLCAVGLYNISRKHDRGEAVRARDALLAWKINPGQLAMMGFILLLCLFVWVRFALLLFMFFFADNVPSVDEAFSSTLLGQDGFSFFMIGYASGGLLAFAVFAITAVSIPYLIDRPKADAITGIITSVRAVKHNIRPMLLWASIIAVYTFVGLATAFVGLVFTVPLIGYASWYAYRDLVAPTNS